MTNLTRDNGEKGSDCEGESRHDISNNKKKFFKADGDTLILPTGSKML